jgi:hypothetical protein
MLDSLRHAIPLIRRGNIVKVSKVVFLIFALWVACGTPACSRIMSYAGAQLITASPIPTRKPIYVTDFKFSPGAFRRESGLLPVHPVAPAAASVVYRTFGVPEDPNCRARELVDLMTSTLTEDLAEAGFDARRLLPDEPPPAPGWIVRGTFTDMNEGNRLGRALVGLGAGRTHLQVFVFVDRLAPGASESSYALNTSAANGEGPGAIFLFSPIVAVARFMSGATDLDTSVVKTASKIARQISRQINGG